MAVATFDTLKYSNAPRNAGIPEQQADALSSSSDEVLKTNFNEMVHHDELKAMLGEIRADMKSMFEQFRFEIKTGFEQARLELKSSNELLRMEMKNQTDQLRHEMKESEQRTVAKIDNLKLELSYVKWLVYVALFGFIMAFIRSLLFKTAVP